MVYKDVIDELIADGHKTVTLYENRLSTDDDDVPITQYLIITVNGDVVARRIVSFGCNWSMIFWPLPSSMCSSLREIWEIDLSNRVEAYSLLSIFP